MNPCFYWKLSKKKVKAGKRRVAAELQETKCFVVEASESFHVHRTNPKSSKQEGTRHARGEVVRLVTVDT